MRRARDSRRDAGGRAGVLGGAAATMLACLLWLLPCAAMATPSERPFEIEPGSFHFAPSSDQAGAHSDWTTAFNFAHNGRGRTYNDLRSTVVNLPPGFIGNNTAVPTCTASQLLSPSTEPGQLHTGYGAACPPASQIGTITFDLTSNSEPVKSTFALYNMETNSPGIAAELGFHAVVITQVLQITVRPHDEGLTITSPNIVEVGEPHEVSVTTWGVPDTAAHNAERGLECVESSGNGALNEGQCYGGGEEVNNPAEPFLTNPTSCGPFKATMEADSWEQSEAWSEAETEVGPITECERVHFDPSIEVQPSTRSAESPTGLAVSLVVPQTWENPYTISTSNLEDTVLTLPAGFTVNPSAGSGLGACTPPQYEAETAESLPGAGCPPESKIGSVEVETPLLDEKLLGAVYVAKPFDNPFDSLLGLYIVVRDPARGIVIKLAGHIEPNPVTGQLVTTFDEAPQAAFSRFTLKFRPGATAPLVSPPACGTYTTQAALTPWSAPLQPQLVSSSFEITQGVHEGPCPSGGVPPFKPQVISGTQNNAGGSYSPFYLRIIREDGEQEITHFSTTLPPGLTGNLTGIEKCPDADIEAARSVSGAEEEERPSCPAASEVGHTLVEAGVGSVLAQNPGKIYLAGPYHGAPLSIVSITAAKVGPFDLGTVVIRFALDINPSTAQVEVSGAQSDPIPHIIQGIVVHVRDIRVYMSREKFTINPTNCGPLSIQDTIIGSGADPTSPADGDPVTVNTPFEAANCSSLRFKPSFSVSTSGKTSKVDGASLTAKLEVAGAFGSQANIRLVKVELPKQLPSRLPTLQKACLARVFEANPAQCPAGSIIGHAKALTPILPVPLEGPAYFVSHGGEAFPSLIVVLQGYGFTIDLVGTTFISTQGITSSTFKTVPDEPVTSFELTLPEGPFSALAAVGSLCKSKLTMPTEFIAQNGAVLDQTTKITATGCPKAKHKRKAARRKSRRRGKKR
jgi:hypothetical protein